jgi:hypothetical protein
MAPVEFLYALNNSIVAAPAGSPSRITRFSNVGLSSDAPKPIFEEKGRFMAIIDTHPDSSILSIVKDLRDDTATLFRQEVALAKREVTGKIAAFGKNSALMVAGAFIGLYAVFFFFLSLNNLLQMGIKAAGFSTDNSAWFAPLVLFMLLGIAALLPIRKGIKALGKEGAAPRRTMESIKEDKDWIKSKVKGRAT